MNSQLFLVESKKVMDVEAIWHDYEQNRDCGRGRQMTIKQKIKCVAPFYFIGFRPGFLAEVLPESSKPGTKPSPVTRRNTMNKDFNPIFKRMLNLPHFTAPEDIYRKGRERYFHGPLRAVSGDALRFQHCPNNGDFNRLEIRAPQFIKSLKTAVAQHKEVKEPLTSVQKSHFEALKRHGDISVDEGDRLFNEGRECASAYNNAIKSYSEALSIDPLGKTLSDDESLWLRVARCYIRLGFYRYAIIICDYALFNIFESNSRKARAFHLLGHALDDLMEQKQDFSEKNLAAIIYCWDQAIHFNKNKLLTRWNKAEAYVKDFERNGVNFIRAKRELEDFIAALQHPMSQNSLEKYRDRLLEDMRRNLENKPQWQSQFDEIRVLLENY